MNLFELLNNQKTDERIAQIVQFVGTDNDLFQELMTLFFEGSNRISHTASWVILQLVEENPKLLDSYHQKLVKLLEDKSNPDGVRRNIARFYQTCIIPNSIEGKLYDICIALIINPTEPIAIKAYSMAVCERIGNRYPELFPELESAIQIILPHASAGVKNRGQKILSRIKKSPDNRSF